MTINSVLEVYKPEQLGKATGNYLKYNEERREWSVVKLNCLEKFLRWIGIPFYTSTTLPFIASKISLEAYSLTELRNKIHKLWQATYPTIRNPLKSEKCTFVDAKGQVTVAAQIIDGGKVKPELMKIKETLISLQLDENVQDLCPIELAFDGMEPSSVTVANKLIDALKIAKDNQVKKISIELDQFINSVGLNLSIQTILSAIEQYVNENPDRFEQIVLTFKPDNSRELIESTNLWRGMVHPHAHFFET